MTDSVARAIAVIFHRTTAQPSLQSKLALRALASVHRPTAVYLAGIQERSDLLRLFWQAESWKEGDELPKDSDYAVIVRAVKSVRRPGRTWITPQLLNWIAESIEHQASDDLIVGLMVGESTSDTDKAFFISPVFRSILFAVRNFATKTPVPPEAPELSLLETRELRRLVAYFNCYDQQTELFCPMTEEGVKLIYSLRQKTYGLFEDSGFPVAALSEFREDEIRAADTMIGEWLLGRPIPSAKFYGVNQSVRDAVEKVVQQIDDEHENHTGKRIVRVEPKETSMVLLLVYTILAIALWLGTAVGIFKLSEHFNPNARSAVVESVRTNQAPPAVSPSESAR